MCKPGLFGLMVATHLGARHSGFNESQNLKWPSLRRIIRRFGSFPTRTYSNRISNDANVRITYEERSGHVLNLNKTCA